MLPDKLANDAGALRRFQQEARAVAALNHPNVVTIHAVDESDGVHFLAMELVEGQMLSELIGGEPLSLGRFFEVSVPLADALATAHDEGITHCDLKPANVMITAAGRIKVLDFGLAKFVGMRHELEATLSAPLTEHGAAVGTFPYMSPEQLEAKVVDHRSDIFSLGVVMYELIAGCRPFVGGSGARGRRADRRGSRGARPRPDQQHQVLPGVRAGASGAAGSRHAGRSAQPPRDRGAVVSCNR